MAEKILATNPKARHHYHILEKVNAGIQLFGTEVKSCRAAKVSLKESYATIEKGEVFLHDMRIEPYTHGNQFNHDPLRPKKLLLKRQEINSLENQIKRKGYTLIPLQLFISRGFIKASLGLGKGKQLVDKREDLKRRTADREAQRAMARAK